MEDKPKKKKTARTWLIVLVIILAVVGIGYLNKDQLFPKKIPPKTQPTQRDPNTILATVNGEEITLGQIIFNKELYLDWFGYPLSEEAVLNQTINEILLKQEAKDQGLGFRETELDTLVEQWLLNIKANSTDTQFAQNLQRDNTTLDEFKKQGRQILETQLLIERILNATVTKDISVSEQEAQRYFTQHPEAFTAKTYQIHIQHILLESKEKANTLLARLREPKNQWDTWEYIVTEFSKDALTSHKSGDLGFIKRSAQPSALEQVAFALKVGEIADPIQSSYGWHLIKRAPDSYTFAEANQTIIQLLHAEKQQKALQLYLTQLRTKADITYGPTQKKEHTETQTTPKDYCTNENGQIPIDFFTSSSCKTCKEQLTTFETATFAKSYTTSIWELDTGDNLATSLRENGVPPQKVELFLDTNPEGTLPLYIVGCKQLFRDVTTLTTSLAAAT